MLRHVSAGASITNFIGACLVVAVVLAIKFGLPDLSRDLPGCELSKVMGMLDSMFRKSLAEKGEADRSFSIYNPERRSENAEVHECKSVVQIYGYADTPFHYEVSWDNRIFGRIIVRMRTVK